MSFLWWSTFLFLIKRITSNDLLDPCNDVGSTSNWSVYTDNQAELDDFMNNVTSFTDEASSRCIQLTLTGGTYRLDVVKMMQLKLGTEGGLVIVGVAGVVNINCTANTSNLEELRNIFKPISNVSLVSFDGLVFNSCPVPMVIEEVSVVVVQNCVFRNHENGALSIFNSANVTVKNCKFTDNNSTSYFGRKPFQGHGGGLSIAYNVRLAQLNSANVIVSDCEFINNRADPPDDLLATTTDLIEEANFSGRGGGLAMPISATFPLNVVVNNSVFINNFAENYGGGLYCFMSETNGNQTYMFGNNTFIGNQALLGAGGINFGNFANTALSTTLHSTIYGCTFEGNKAEYGGCLITYPSYLGFGGNFIKFQDCTFSNNTSVQYDGVIDVTSINIHQSRLHYEPVEFINCMFDGNFGASGGIIDFSFYSGKLENVTFNRNTGPVVRAIGTTIDFYGSVSFTNNDAEGFDGGAMYMLTFSQMTLNNGAQLEFTNNTGGLGAAIVVETGTILPPYAVNSYNPRCFIQYRSTSVSPINWKEVSITFKGNNALIGSTIYANRLDLCSWYSPNPPYINTDLTNVLRWPFISYSDGNNLNINSGHIDDHSMNQTLSVQTPAVDFTVYNDTIAAYPGEPLKVFILPYDEQYFPTSQNFRILENSGGEMFSFAFDPTAKAIQPSNPTFTVKYSLRLKSIAEIRDELLNSSFSVEVSALRTRSALTQRATKYFTLLIKPCPPGHVLNATGNTHEHSCKCDDRDQNIKSCLSRKKLVLQESLWAHFINNGSMDSILEYHHCPPGYCRCSKMDDNSEACTSVYSYDNEDDQCVCDREGFLCGKCQYNKGVSVLFTKCKSCKSIQLLLIPTLVVIDVILIVVILLSSFAITSWLYPLLFYIQVIPIAAQYFPATFSLAQPYLHYISSAANLYFPYDFCLYPGMTALASYSFRYIPFLLTVIISIIVYTANRKFKIAKNKRLSWSGLWLLTLLLYTDVVNTSVSILNCPLLSDPDGTKRPRWYIDGTVKCFTGGHLPLAIVAILVLIFCVLVMVFVAAVVMRKIKNYWTFSMAKILTIPFTVEHNWWAPVELLRRLVFIIFLVVSPGNLAPVLLLTMVYMAVIAYIKPYHMLYINLLEMGTLVDIFLLLTIASTNRFKDPVFTAGTKSQAHVDDCGKFNSISDHAVMLVPFYYLPLLILIALLLKKVCTAFICRISRWSFHKRSRGMEMKVVAAGDDDDTIMASATILSYVEFDDQQELMITHFNKKTLELN